ncbi:polysaccharide lyase family 8 super-sandwich domain-containing protein [Ruania halotolerans]|uniref:polysaccharide lyase family 8 super-sandwich domain-containing protein n=1 Tax=Ruania halotolerans TaxID=2897773 RepID=UPI001E629A77|nr:polysaccharide lyase family 8 super-sandwich domain-containing protein [Ruania halotolerans]UFU05959.1 DNRLRE domain-containing protein [Ruania halotolerans]
MTQGRATDHPIPAVSRRAVLAGFGGVALLSGTLPGLGRFSASSAHADPGDSYAAALDVWRELLTGGADFDPGDPRLAAAVDVLDAEVADVIPLITRTPGRNLVFTDLMLDEPPMMTSTYRRLASMATAFVTPGSDYQDDPAVLADVLAGLRTTHDIAYHPDRDEPGNWWEWEIGSARASMDACILVADHLSDAEIADYTSTIDYFVPDPFYQFLDSRRTESTGANRIDLCRAVALRGLLGRSEQKVLRARDGISAVFEYVDSGDGFYRDGSFVQHGNVAYTGTYGEVLLDGTSRLITLLSGSPWEIVDPDRHILFDAVDLTFAPVMVNGLMMDFVSGRAISRENASDSYHGRLVIDHILRLADGVAVERPDVANRWRARCKGWLERSTFGDVFTEARVPRAAAYAALLEDDSIEPLPEPQNLALFPAMARAVGRGEGWAHAISMSSKRIAYYEAGNGENERGFHTGAGMTYLYNDDHGQFTDAFWPTVDLYRLPGTTVDSKPLPDAVGGEWGTARPPSATWAGGASLGAYGAVGQHLQGIASTLEARKSWFYLGEVVVALGAGITGGGAEHPVETVVENRNLHADGTNTLLLNGDVQPAHQDWSAHAPVRWAHLEGVGGYIFPRGSQLHLRREERTGSWSDVHESGSTDPITRRYLTMWFDHGVRPEDDSYAYMLLPGGSPAQTEELARPGRSRVQILENSRGVQAVRRRSLGLTAVNFWGAAGADTITTLAAADAHVNDGQHAGTNYGTRTLMLVKHVAQEDSGYSRQSYLRFDLSDVTLPPDDVAVATLHVRARVNDAGGTIADVIVHAVDETWEESALTWNTKPPLGEEITTVQIDSGWAWHAIELTAHAVEKLRSGSNLSLALAEPDGPTNGLSIEISSRESADAPYVSFEPIPQSQSVARITTANPCSVVLDESDPRALAVAVSDPTQEQDTVSVTIAGRRFRTWEADATIDVTREGNDTRLTVRTEGSLGATHRVTFRS